MSTLKPIMPHEVERQLQKIRANAKTYDAVSRAARVGDKVTFSYSSTYRGFVAERWSGISLIIGAASMPPAFNTALLGSNAGAIVEFSLNDPPLVIKAVVETVEEERPLSDAEIAAKGEFPNVDALWDWIADQLWRDRLMEMAKLTASAPSSSMSKH